MSEPKVDLSGLEGKTVLVTGKPPLLFPFDSSAFRPGVWTLFWF
jgi:hypothetical protein